MTTERGVRYFEEVQSVPVGGTLVMKMTDWVVAPPENIPPGTSGDALFRLQQCLAYVGQLDPAHVTGRWDEATDAALRRFQKSASLKQDAWYGQGSRTAMRLALGEEAAEAPDDDEHEAIEQEAEQEDEQPFQPTTTTPTTTTPAPAAPGSYLFRDAFEVVDAKAYLRDAAKKSTGKVIPQGTLVYVVDADRTYVKIATAPGAAETIKASDNVWTAFSNLGGSGAVVPLGNEKTDAQDKKDADAARASLPPGRAAKSPYKWRFSSYFQPSLDGKDLDSPLMAKVWRLMQWAIQNDMVTGDIVIGDGVRSPKRAHQMCVAWEIQYGPKRVTFEAVKSLPGGKDLDGNVWYRDGWTWEDVKANANKVRASKAIAAAGHEFGDKRRLPLPLNAKPGVSLHCTGRAVDVTIPWRKQGVAASQNKTDVWGWENVYKLFGLHRPLYKGHPNEENWHIQETSKKLVDVG